MVKKMINKVLSKILQLVNNYFFESQKILIGQMATQMSKMNKSHSKMLWDYEVKVFSQWGEDGILDFLCSELEIFKPRMLELGAGNFIECNSRFLAENLNASVVAVDSREDLVPTVKSMDIYWRTSVLPLPMWITPTTIIEIDLEAKNFLYQIDIISLDIDGNDYWVAQEINFEGVRIVIVEYNPIFGDGQAVSIPREDDFDRTKAHYSNLYYGVSLKAWINFFNSINFKFIGSNRAGNNAFFVLESEISKLTLKLPDVENLSIFVDWRVRESRNERGELTSLSMKDGRTLIADLPLIDLENHIDIKVSDLIF